jgi:dTDP-4-dehydrorhamnose 3,5-epimerase
MAPSEPLLIELSRHEDERGHLTEYHSPRNHPLSDVIFVQDNVSWSHQWVLRGLHYQLPPYEQGKLIWATRGTVFDVVVDVRHTSPHFGRWQGYTLDDTKVTQLWVPPGFAHGFLALTEPAVLHYKVTAPYSPETDRSIRWDDPRIEIDWPLAGHAPIVSEKDSSAPTLDQAEVF